MSAIAGRVLILPKGDYDASVTYEFLDLVNHNSSSWLAKKASQGVEPSDANSEFWQKFGSSVTPDGVTIVIDENGVISAVGGTAEKVTYENENVADVTNVKEALDVIFDGGIDVDISALTTNLLNFVKSTQEANGITFTNNKNGTFTLNGTASANVNFTIMDVTPLSQFPNKFLYKVFSDSAEDKGSVIVKESTEGDFLADFPSGVIDTVQIKNDYPSAGVLYFIFAVKQGDVFDNVVFKPMFTTNLSATADDFVPYTGNTGKLNGDVAEIRKDYLPLSGGTVGVTSWNSFIVKRTNSTNNDSLHSAIMFANADGLLGGIGYEKSTPILLTPSGTVKGTLLHTGNKPSGTYTGNGSATSRTISTGGIGNVCIINSTYGVALVTEYGAFVKLASSTSVSGLSNTAVNFKNGVLTISTTDQKVNNSAVEYTYTVL